MRFADKGSHQVFLEPEGLESGVIYYWRARVVHRCGHVSDWTPCWSFSLDLDPPLPGLQLYQIRTYPCHELLSHRFETGCMIWL